MIIHMRHFNVQQDQSHQVYYLLIISHRHKVNYKMAIKSKNRYFNIVKFFAQ